MTKKEIIIEYLSIEGNKKKSQRTAIREILDTYSVSISTGMYAKTVKEVSRK